MIAQKKMKFYGLRDIDKIPQLKKLTKEQRLTLKVVGNVLPFRSNNYLVDELINWDNIPDDPIFQLTFPQRGMILPEHFDQMADLINKDAPKDEIVKTAHEIREEMNPHPAGQMTANVPVLADGESVPGVQRKYREIALIFPSAGQTCHAYCTFCFRWAQFIGDEDLKFATDESRLCQKFIKQEKELTDVLFTGGDPMVMSLAKLKAYVEPLLKPEFDHIQNIRIGTKSLGYWPYKYVTDKDADGILQMFERIIKAGKHISIMAHFNHGVELSSDVVKEAIKRIRNTGAVIRTQSPLIRHINDDPDIWADMWKEQVRLGLVPYYMFVERDTGAKNYFEVPLAQAFDIYKNSFNQVSGLARTARGPSMSAMPGKIIISGIAEIKGEKVFVLNFLQARNPEWAKQPFFAKYDEEATWLNMLKPAFGKDKFFYEDELQDILKQKAHFAKQPAYESELVEEM